MVDSFDLIRGPFIAVRRIGRAHLIVRMHADQTGICRRIVECLRPFSKIDTGDTEDMTDADLFQSLIQIAGDSFATRSGYLRTLLAIKVPRLKMR